MALQIINEDGLVAEAHSLPQLLHHVRRQNGKKIYIKDTNVYIKSHLDAGEISSACVLSMLAISEQHHIEDYMAIIHPNPDQQRDVAAVTARIFSLFDPTHDKVILFSSNPHSASILSYISPKEIQQMIVANASREHCFHRCIFTSEQSAALFDHDSSVHLNLDRCSMDSSAMADVLARKETTHSLGKLTLVNGSHNEDPSMESFWIALNKPSDDLLFDEIVLKGYSFRSADAFHLAGANVRCLGLADDCQFEESACDLLVAAVEKSSLRAQSLKLHCQDHHGDTETHWSLRLIRAIGHQHCTLEELHLRRYENGDYVNVDSAILDMLRRNTHLRRLNLSATPLQFPSETWSTFLETLSCHRSLREVTLRPPSEPVPQRWKDELERVLFQKKQEIRISVKAQQPSDRADMARLWQEACEDARLRGTCRITDDRARSFVLTSVLEQHSNKHGLVFSLLLRNQDLLACR